MGFEQSEAAPLNIDSGIDKNSSDVIIVQNGLDLDEGKTNVPVQRELEDKPSNVLSSAHAESSGNSPMN